MDDNLNKMELEIQKRRDDNDNEVIKTINAIAKKSIDTLTFEEKAFLQARESYLTNGQREEYRKVLNEDLTGEKTLKDFTRAELEVKAIEAGIEDPSLKVFKTKDQLIEAIEATQN